MVGVEGTASFVGLHKSATDNLLVLFNGGVCITASSSSSSSSDDVEDVDEKICLLGDEDDKETGEIRPEAEGR